MLLDSEAYLEEVLNLVSDGVYVVDTRRRILFWNRSAEQITGFPREEVEGRSCSENILVHVFTAG